MQPMLLIGFQLFDGKACIFAVTDHQFRIWYIFPAPCEVSSVLSPIPQIFIGVFLRQQGFKLFLANFLYNRRKIVLTYFIDFGMVGIMPS